jgi:hypothetical protein
MQNRVKESYEEREKFLERSSYVPTNLSTSLVVIASSRKIKIGHE